MTFSLTFEPADTLAIGDGRPFNQGDTGRAVAASVFPPPPDTLYGAARVACARSLGWDGVGSWGDTISKTMGSWSTKGEFEIAGPFFEASGSLLLPIPSHVVLADCSGCQELILRTPSTSCLSTDLGEVQLPDIPPYADDVKTLTLTGRWANADAVLKLLKGEKPDLHAMGAPVKATRISSPNPPPKLPGWSAEDLAAREFRVGLARETRTRKAVEGHLYTSVRRDFNKGVKMFVEVHGLDQPKNYELAVNFGGEARFAFTSVGGATLPDQNTITSDFYLVYFATPVVTLPPVQGMGFAGLPGKVVSMSIAKLDAHGGRVGNSAGKGKRSQASVVLQAGSVVFMKGECLSELPARIGDNTHMGYGRYFTGVWR